MNLWLLYLIVTLPNLSKLLGFFSVVIGICLLVGWVMHIITSMYEDESDTTIILKKVLKRITPIWVLVAFLSVIIPGKEQMYTLIGVYYSTNIEQIEELPPNVVKSLNKFLENYAEDYMEKEE